MTVSRALTAEILDVPARARRFARVGRFARRWHAQPRFAELRCRLGAIEAGSATAAEAALAAARPMLERIDWIARGITAMARRIARDSLFEPPLRAVRHEGQQGLVLFDHAYLRITVLALPADAIAARKVADLGRRAIGFTGQRSLYRFERAAGAKLDLWEASDPAGEGFSIERPGCCRAVGQRALADGALLEIDGARQAWTFARAPSDILLVQATARVGGAPFATEYDARDGTFLSANAGDIAGSRLQMMAAVLGRMARADALPALAAIARDAPFTLRWQMAREMVALDPVAALPTIRRMALADPHDEVRTAARATMALLAA